MTSVTVMCVLPLIWDCLTLRDCVKALIPWLGPVRVALKPSRPTLNLPVHPNRLRVE